MNVLKYRLSRWGPSPEITVIKNNFRQPVGVVVGAGVVVGSGSETKSGLALIVKGGNKTTNLTAMFSD